MHRLPLYLLPLLAGLVGLAGCTKPPLPDHDKRPEPQAAAAGVTQPTPLREAMQSPLDKAQAAQAVTDAAAEQQRNAIDAATGQ